MSHPSRPPRGGALHRIVVDAEPDPNVLLRLLEPFVIHDVLPHAIHVAHEAHALTVELEFTCDVDLAARLKARLAAMISVRAVTCSPVAPNASAAA